MKTHILNTMLSMSIILIVSKSLFTGYVIISFYYECEILSEIFSYAQMPMKAYIYELKCSTLLHAIIVYSLSIHFDACIKQVEITFILCLPASRNHVYKQHVILNLHLCVQP